MFRYAKNVRLASFCNKPSKWLSLTPTLAPSGSNLLSQAFTGSLWLLVDLSLSLSGSLWLSVAPTLALTGSHCHSLAHYCSLISRIQPLIGSQGPCSALIADATMTHFIPLWNSSDLHVNTYYQINLHAMRKNLFKFFCVLSGAKWFPLSHTPKRWGM